jgi:RecA-family ATPase
MSDLAVWIGREKHRKSNLLLLLAIAAALGRSFLTFQYIARSPLRAVYVDYESKPTRLKQRYEGICSAMKLTIDEKRLLKDNLQIHLVRERLRTGSYIPRFPADANKDQGAADWWKNFRQRHSADLYIFDPMRCLHAGDENDSKIEQLLASLRLVFGKATIIVAHHMRKRDKKNDASLVGDMRAWSDGARGSVAIKAHSDVVVCQERVMENQTEVVYLGAFSKDAPDIEPLPLQESDAESFYWNISPHIPGYLRDSYNALRQAGTQFTSKSEAASAIKQATKVSRATAFRHVQGLEHRGLLVPEGAAMILKDGEVCRGTSGKSTWWYGNICATVS